MNRTVSGGGEGRSPDNRRPWYNLNATRVLAVGAIGLLVTSSIVQRFSSDSAPSVVSTSRVTAGNGCVADRSEHNAYALKPGEYNAVTGEVNMGRLETDLSATIPGVNNCVDGQFTTIMRAFNQGDTPGTAWLNIHNDQANAANSSPTIDVPTSFAG
ncbi:MAG TPA: hypothetical protein VIH90_03620 [Candidatus Saccharimonadales bacterium]